MLLHGTPFSSYIWRHIASALAHHHRVYVWDMPGYGTSEMTDGQDLSLGALAAVFADLLKHWELAEPLVVAHDSGGAVALGAHLLHGARYRRLALVDAVALAPWGSPFFQLVGEHADTFGALPSKLHQALLREYVNSASSPGLHPAVLEALVAPWLDEAGQAAFYRQLAQRTDDQSYIDGIQDRYTTIDLPVTVCWGQNDNWIPHARGRELADLIPDARFRTIPDAGHLVQEDNPAELAAAILTFLHDIGRGTSAFSGRCAGGVRPRCACHMAEGRACATRRRPPARAAHQHDAARGPGSRARSPTPASRSVPVTTSRPTSSAGRRPD